jgi:hypothetical protein
MGGIQSGVQLHETLNAVASAGVHVSIQPCPNSGFSIVISSPKHCSRTPLRSMRLPSRRDCNALCFNSIDLNAPAICELIQFWLLSSYHLTLPHRSAHSLTAPLCSLTLRSPRWPHRRTHVTSLPIELKFRSPPINSAQPRLPRTDAISPRLSVIHRLRSIQTSLERCHTPVVGPPRRSRRTRRLLPGASSSGMLQSFCGILFQFFFQFFFWCTNFVTTAAGTIIQRQRLRPIHCWRWRQRYSQGMTLELHL